MITVHHKLLTFFGAVVIGLLIAPDAEAQTLEQYQERAGEENPGVRSERKAYHAAEEAAREVRSPDDPLLSFGYFVSPPSPRQVKFSVMQSLPWFGSFRTAGEAADLAAQAQYQAWLDAGHEAQYRAALAWFELHEWQELLAVERRNRDLLESYKEIATIKFEGGQGTMANVLRLDIRLKEAETRIDILQDRRRALVAQFNRVLGRPVDETVALADTLVYAPPGFPAVPVDTALAKNPRLNNLELLAESAERRRELARKRGAPNFSIGFDYVFVEEQPALEMPNDGTNVFMPMVTISLPIFRGKYDAAMSSARLQSEEFRLRKKDLLYELQAEYENGMYEISRNGDLIDLYERQIDETFRALDLVLADYAGGGTEFEAILDLQSDLLEFQRARIAAITDLYAAQAQLTYLLAGANDQ